MRFRERINFVRASQNYWTQQKFSLSKALALVHHGNCGVPTKRARTVAYSHVHVHVPGCTCYTLQDWLMPSGLDLVDWKNITTRWWKGVFDWPYSGIGIHTITTRNPLWEVFGVTGEQNRSKIIMCQRKFAEMSSQMYRKKKKLNSYSNYSYHWNTVNRTRPNFTDAPYLTFCVLFFYLDVYLFPLKMVIIREFPRILGGLLSRLFFTPVLRQRPKIISQKIIYWQYQSDLILLEKITW